MVNLILCLLFVFSSPSLYAATLSRSSLSVSVSKEVSDAVSLALDKDPNIVYTKFDDKSDLNIGMMNASKNVTNNITAVIGHMESYIALPVSPIYELNKIIMINPSATSTDLNKNNYKYLLSAVPNDLVMSKSLVKYFQERRLNRVLLCYTDNEYGKSFANSFEKSCEEGSIVVVDRISFVVGNDREFRNIANKWENYKYDSIMFIGYEEDGINFVKVIRSGIGGTDKFIPIITGEALGTKKFLDSLGDLADGIVMPVLFYPESRDAINFIDLYKKRFKRDPDFSDAIAYDVAKMLSKAIKDIKSEGKTDRSKLSYELLKHIKESVYKGIVYDYKFHENGSLVVPEIGLQGVLKGQFEYLGRY